jgi:iron complex transport system ATP-binding protein
MDAVNALALANIAVRRGGRAVLQDVSATVERGEVLGIVGPNGAGKSTLLRVMAGLLRPQAGMVLLDDKPIGDWPRKARARHLAYLPQDAACHWPIRADRLVALGRLPHLEPWRCPTGRDGEAVDRAMHLTEVHQLAARTVDTLSGGERARVLLARTFAGEPAILLADEPVADLDPYHALRVMGHLARLAQEGTGVAVVLHDLTLAARFCRRLLLLDRGRVAAYGPPETVLAPEILARIYQIDAVRGSHAGEPYLVPWSARDDGETPA